MNAVEFLANNCELRSFFLFFRQRTDCNGIQWTVSAGDNVKPGQVIGELAFATGGPVPIVAPVAGVVVRTYDPNVADLPHRPSLPIALFQTNDAAPSELQQRAAH